jgi:hypothetical protein
MTMPSQHTDTPAASDARGALPAIARRQPRPLLRRRPGPAAPDRRSEQS